MRKRERRWGKIEVGTSSHRVPELTDVVFSVAVDQQIGQLYELMRTIRKQSEEGGEGSVS